MQFLLYLIPLLIAILSALIVAPYWIRKCRESGLVWEDMNKYNHPKNVASSGGIIAILSFVLGVLTYLAFRTVFKVDLEVNIQIFALLSTILIFAIIGLADDLIGWKNGGLSKRSRVILALLASIPLVVINAGVSSIEIPFIGLVNLGIIYPLFFIPIGIAGAATTFNFLAGFNGLEAGQGIIILSFLSYVSYTIGKPWLAFIGIIMVVSLISFYLYNKYPAKVFPGGILTYSIGSLIAIIAILGNFEKIALFVFIPNLIEIALKSRGKLKKHSFGIPQKDGTLKLPYPKIYGLTHLSIFILSKIKSKVYEKDVVYLIFTFQLVIILLAWFIFF